jgi:hypothetical protein
LLSGCLCCHQSSDPPGLPSQLLMILPLPTPIQCIVFMWITTPAANAYPKCYSYRAREFRGEEVRCMKIYHTIHKKITFTWVLEG